ncbi:dynein assembly factor with WDR repeat domains 1-like isoform X2 [Sphaerodactylus townsendi]|uniref:dynein assembly factor with WDR repeat domains 1-like isoform X2 n=1 Tax=Sphaerodactylus townsendi TaxID=933632 RepID=UPI0020276965|nr:dynein assembly factor with WDR repeat domains 1-like isoform X2 [Sphaerodactylus townsendi]
MVKLWHVSSRTCVRTMKEDRQTMIASFNPSGSKFITGGAGPGIYMYDTQTWDNLGIFQSSDNPNTMDGHWSRVYALTFFPDNDERFLSGGWDNTVQFWSVQLPHSQRYDCTTFLSIPSLLCLPPHSLPLFVLSTRLLFLLALVIFPAPTPTGFLFPFTSFLRLPHRRLSGPHICGDAVSIDKTGTQILTGSWRRNNCLQIWDAESGNKIMDIPDDFRGQSQVEDCFLVSLPSFHMVLNQASSLLL